MALVRAPSAAILLVLAACAAVGAPSTSTEPASDEPSASSPSGRPEQSLPPVVTVPPSTSPVTGEVPNEILDRILDDAVVRTGTDRSAIVVTRAESVTWSDGSLDCPEPGMMYTQALVDGYHVILDADGEELDYRATASGNFVLCVDGRPAE
jgi:hypothetical protein